jgi:hypothetical protein
MTHRMQLAGAIALAVLTTACSEQPTAPAAAPFMEIPQYVLSGAGPTFIAGNISGEAAAVCNNSVVNTTSDTWLGIKVNSNASMSSAGITTTITSGKFLAWVSSSKLVQAVVVKGGPDTNLYRYNHGAYPTPAMSDNGLLSPDAGGGVPDISHYVICYMDPPVIELQDLVVSKDADASYERLIEWTLTKTVNGQASASYTGTPGQTFTPTWNVTATKTTDLYRNHLITGTITVGNPNPVAVGVSIADVLRNSAAAPLAVTVQIRCGAEVAWVNAPVTRTVPAEGSLVCAYRATPSNTDAVSNRVDVTVDQASYTVPDGYEGTINGGFWIEGFAWDLTTIGDPNPTLADDRSVFGAYFTPGQAIGATTPLNVPETFACPAYDEELYASPYNQSYVNNASLKGNDLDLAASATVNLTCAVRWEGESATGRGWQWPGNNWFQYSASGNTDIVYGRQLQKAGSITMGAAPQAGWTRITFTFDSGFRIAPVGGNVKVHPMSGPPSKNVAPGQYKYKFNMSGNSFHVDVPNANYYGIHLDIQRLVY